MVRLSNAVLLRVHRILLEIHAAGDVDTQRRLIPQALSRLIACDRAAVNEFDIGRKLAIIPSPMPAYWRCLGPVLFEHLHDHVLMNPAQGPIQHKTATFGDRRHDLAWKKSVLYNDYYVPAGARHQLGIHVFQQGTVRLSLNCNRWNRDFSAEERAVLELISPHVECAWRNASELTRLRNQLPSMARRQDSEPQTVIVDCGADLIVSLSPGARSVLCKYFDEDPIEGCAVPDDLRRWLKVQRDLLTSSEVGDTPRPLCVRKKDSLLLVRLVQVTPAVATILLEEQPAARVEPCVSIAGFTRRENEILHWICEGKRNGEIGTILRLSPRTVEKHLEHVFEKLGVETRTAAAHAAFELGRRSDA